MYKPISSVTAGKEKSLLSRDTGQNTTKSKSTPNVDFLSTSAPKRMSISLSADAVQMLEYIAKSQGLTQNEALRKAIATEAYLLREMAQGSKVLLQKADKEVREVVFR
jgi:hypothetical protein